MCEVAGGRQIARHCQRTRRSADFHLLLDLSWTCREALLWHGGSWRHDGPAAARDEHADQNTYCWFAGRHPPFLPRAGDCASLAPYATVCSITRGSVMNEHI